MSERLSLSVILCVRNGENHVLKQLSALASQCEGLDCEILVVDNGSTDNTRSVVSRFIETMPRLPVRLVDASGKPGIPFARNSGALASKGLTLAFCDADDVVYPGWISSWLGHAPAGVAAGRILPRFPSGEPATGTVTEGIIDHPYLPFAGGCNFAVARDCFFAVGGFDESLPPYGFDDTDFSWRAQEAGYALGYVPSALVSYTVSDKSAAVRKVFNLGRAQVAVMKRHPASVAPGSATVSKIIAGALSAWIVTPWRLLRPSGISRPRSIRLAIEEVGKVFGAFQYLLLERGPAPKPTLRDPLGSQVGG